MKKKKEGQGGEKQRWKSEKRKEESKWYRKRKLWRRGQRRKESRLDYEEYERRTLKLKE